VSAAATGGEVVATLRKLIASAALTGVLIGAWVDVSGHSAGSSGGGGGTSASVASAPMSGGGSTSANLTLGQQMAADGYGWTGQQWSCLDTLWQGESGWSQYADSEQTGLTDPGQPFAYGIPQSYPSTKMPLAAQPASAGGSSDPRAQISWGLAYISSEYGSPCAALDFKQSHGDEGY
jgi:hypothetical protein